MKFKITLGPPSAIPNPLCATSAKSTNMEYSDDYGRQFGNLAESLFGKRIFPNDLIRDWRGLIEDIKDGYQSIHLELDQDLDDIRGSIDMLLLEDALDIFPEHESFKENIKSIDEQYLNLTQEYPKWNRLGKKWWSARILKFAGKEYVDFMYGTGVLDAGLTIQEIE